MQILREIFGVREDNEEALFLVGEPSKSMEEQCYCFACRFRRSYYEVVDVVGGFEELVLEISGGVDVELPEALRDDGVVREELAHVFLLFHGC